MTKGWAFGVVVTVFLLASCAGGVSTTRTPVSTAAHDRALPEGWRRVQVREGFVGRELENPLAGFTVDLPPGWEAGESWPSRQGPAGWIAGPAPGDREDLPLLLFYMGAGFGHNLDELGRDPREDVRRVVIDGQPAILHLAAPDAIDLGPQVGIFFEHIPGGATSEELPSLRIEGDSRGFVDQELLARVLSSVRYAEIEELPRLPEPGPSADPEWQRVPVRSDWPSFTVKLPPGWETTTLRGIDTLVGRISGEGMTLTYDFGGFAGPMYSHDIEVRERRHIPHLIWEERIGDGLFWFARPVSPEADERGFTGVFAAFETDPAPQRTSPISVPRVAVYAHGLNGSQQDKVLAILRTIGLER